MLSQDSFTHVKIIEDPKEAFVGVGYIYQYLPYYKLKHTLFHLKQHK